jgi:hypothetical protein
MRFLNQRPLSVIVVALLLLATGVVGTVFHATELKTQGTDAAWAVLISLIAVVCGIGLLRGSGWARWLALAWLAFHVVLSLHSRPALLMHGALLAVFAYLLFRPASSAYFRAAPPQGT